MYDASLLPVLNMILCCRYNKPSLFAYTIQRLGCLQDNGDQKPGCGGFGKVLTRNMHDRLHFFTHLCSSWNTQNLLLNAILDTILLRGIFRYFQYLMCRNMNEQMLYDCKYVRYV